MKWFGNKKNCNHENNVRIKKYHLDDGTPMVDTQCFDCGYTDSGHVYTDDWKDELIVKRNGKIIINENLRKKEQI